LATKTNSTKNLSNSDLSLEIKRLGNDLKKEEKVKVSIPSAFKNQLGPSLFVGVNGSAIYIPVDGEDHEVPKTIAAHVKQYIKGLK
jgi:hypothetical protein